MTVDAIIIDNLTVQSLEIGYQLSWTRRSATLAPSRHLVIKGIHLEQLAENVRLILLTKQYVRARYYAGAKSVPKPLDWVLTGDESRCVALATLSDAEERTITGHIIGTESVTFAGMPVVSSAVHYTLTGTAVGTEHVTKTAIRAGFDIKKTVTAVSSVTKTNIRAGFDLARSISVTESVTFTGMPVSSPGSTWDTAFPNAADGTTTNTTYSTDKLSATLTNADFSSRATTRKATGKWYFEMTLVSAVSAVDFICGIIPDTATGLIRVYECGDHFTFENNSLGTLYALSNNGGNQASSFGYVGSPVVGDIYGFIIDLDTPVIKFIYHGVTYTSPYTPTAGHYYRPSASTGQAASASPKFSLNVTGPFNYTVPSGFTAWG